jgi:hypothetical protein
MKSGWGVWPKVVYLILATRVRLRVNADGIRQGGSERDEVKVNFQVGQISRTVAAFRGLLLVGPLAVFAVSADAEVDKRCAEAAALWIPSSASPGKTVVKWNKPIKYDILLPDNNTEFRHSIEEPLHLLAQQSGLKADVGQSPDLSILLAPDISIAAPNIRKYVEDFFNDFFSSGSYRGREGVKIDPAQWEAKHRGIIPKCYSLPLIVSSLIVRAFVLIQRGESPQCINIGLGESFGLMNIREYYAAQAQNIPADLVAIATRTLYEKKVIAGSSQVEAEKVVSEVCK